MNPQPPRSTRPDTLFPSTTLFRSQRSGSSIPSTREQLYLDRHGIAPSSINALLDAHGVSARFDCITLDTAGMDYWLRSEEHTSELQSLMRISYAVFCLKKKKKLIYTE